MVESPHVFAAVSSSQGRQRHAYWALVKSERTAKGPRQKGVAYLGDLDEAGRLGVSRAAGVADTSRQGDSFDAPPQPRWVEVDVSAVRVEGTRNFGGPWPAMQLIGRLGFKTLLDPLMPIGREGWRGLKCSEDFSIKKLRNSAKTVLVCEQRKLG